MATFIGKERYFHELTPAQMKKGMKEAGGNTIEIFDSVDGIVEEIERMDDTDHIIINNIIEKQPLIPEIHYKMAHGGPYPLDGATDDVGAHFLRHGPEALMRRYGSTIRLEDAIDQFRKTKKGLPNSIDLPIKDPVFYFLIAECANAFEKAKELGKGILSGYSFYPVVGNDRTRRKVFLHQLHKAMMNTKYSEQEGAPKTELGNTLYDAGSSRQDGAIIQIKEVPSSTAGKPSYRDFDIFSVALARNRFMLSTAYSIRSGLSNHGFKRRLEKQFRNPSGNSTSTRDPRTTYFVEQDIVPYWKFMMDFYNLPAEEIKRINGISGTNQYHKLVPAAACQFRLMNQDTIDYGLRLDNKVSVRYKDNHGKVKERNLTVAEKEILLTSRVNMHPLGIWETYFLPTSTKFKDLDVWDRPTRRYDRAA